MSGDLAGAVTPYVLAAAAAYGGAVLTKVKDEAADEAVEFGRRMARRIFGARAEIPEVLADAIDEPHNVIALRSAIREALAGDADLAAYVRRLTEEARAAVTYGDRSPAVRTNNGIIATGDHNTFSGDR